MRVPGDRVPIALMHAQDDAARAARLRKAQEDFQMEDEHTDGQQANSLLLLQKEGKLKAKQVLSGSDPTVKKDMPASKLPDEKVRLFKGSSMLAVNM